ncbi:protein argonaute 4A isoform X2 [Amborella trichopoda]|uniref:protein argonaute 4A isoform X2 n=1 Tax=Amborella trichopoda TaxID=13333 RepID=UPI0005D3F751|nr:protein argonaute 4A isoform X2 [Amborella trichopoda]|eukprot:XP_011626455.1 protein argonaute 4A isoform X2 [Amborella trichopoda]
MDPSDTKIEEVLPPPPPLPPNVIPTRIHQKITPIQRKGFGSLGRKIKLLTNHFQVNFNSPDGFFFQYSVALASEDKWATDTKGIGRRALDRVYQTYKPDFSGKELAYDGEHTLFTVGALPRNNMDFTVVLEDLLSDRPGRNGSPSEEDRKRQRRLGRSRTIKVEITFAAKIPLGSIAAILRGDPTDNSQDALRVLDIILRQHAAKQGCLLVRQSFFHNDPRNIRDLGGGVSACSGFHSSFRPTQNGLSLNMDVSTTIILKPGDLVEFLLENQKLNHPRDIDWKKARRVLKNFRISTRHTNQEFKIMGFSEKICEEQLFPLRVKNGDSPTGNGSPQEIKEITVYEYFVNHRNIALKYSGKCPCIDVGRRKRPTYIPVELCVLLPLQRYTKALTTIQRANLVEKSRQKPRERMAILSEMIFGKGEVLVPQNGRWNVKQLYEPVRVERWVLVNFSARCDINYLARQLVNCGRNKGVNLSPPCIIEEDSNGRFQNPLIRVDRMIAMIFARLGDQCSEIQFVFCVLPDRKNSDIYGPWKKKLLTELGVPTQCACPVKVNDPYLYNILLKVNSKLGGINSLLDAEKECYIPIISSSPTIILGMDVSHGSPGQADNPSISAVVSSRCWPLISRYRAFVRTQSPKVEMIDSLFQPSEDGKDTGFIRGALFEFFESTKKRKPEQMIIFRDGVSESQFTQVLNIEVDQIIQACNYLEDGYRPKITVIIAQKNHHTRFFQRDSSNDNVPPGTVVDSGICHPRNYDFYLCAHAGPIGTSRPVHYHVLMDEIGFSPDDLQMLVYALSHVYQRSTTSISVVSPISYAHLAATQMQHILKASDDSSETSSIRSGGGGTSTEAVQVPELPKLHKAVSQSMFFC